VRRKDWGRFWIDDLIRDLFLLVILVAALGALAAIWIAMLAAFGLV
jgi:hypothetical protein